MPQEEPEDKQKNSFVGLLQKLRTAQKEGSNGKD
jgi:hypothetical protein